MLSKIKKIRRTVVLLGAIAVAIASSGQATACTRVLYQGPEDTVLTGRTMDWASDLGSNLWAFPRGMKRHGAAGPKSINWTSKYGSIIASAFGAASSDGMNEKGLVANLLYLTEAEYVTPEANDPRKPLAISAWVQYVLDNYATVDEAVREMEKEPFYVVAFTLPDGHKGQLHMSISDASGDSAIIECVGRKQIIHHDRSYQVMTNSPIFEKQLVLNSYWEEIGGLTMLPGTNRASDRFARAMFYIRAIPQTADMNKAVAGVFSVVRNVSVPTGITTPDKPNISSTIWRSVSDQKNRRYFFESVMSPSIFWVNMDDLDIKEGASVMKLTLTDGKIFSGNSAASFEPAEPFKFMESE